MNQLTIKYKPKSWNEIIGQQPITQILKKRSIEKNWPLAILLKGPSGTGKTSTALLIAKSMVCQNLKDTGDPCNECSSCKSIDLEIFDRDVIMLDGSQAGKEDVINLDSFLKTAPMYDTKKVIIIEESDQLSVQAKNSFLKILEKPINNIHFIFLSMEPWNIPFAIQSRCQQFNFRTLKLTDIMIALKNILEKENLWNHPEIPKSFYLEGLSIIAEYSGGSLRQAVQLLETCLNGGFYTEKDITENLGIITESSIHSILLKLSKKDPSALSDIVTYIHNNKLNEFFGLSYAVLSEALLFKFTDITKFPEYRKKQLAELTATPVQIHNIQNLLQNVYTHIAETNNFYIKKADFITRLIQWYEFVLTIKTSSSDQPPVRTRKLVETNNIKGGY